MAWEWLYAIDTFSDRPYWTSLEERIDEATPRSWAARSARALARCDVYAAQVRARRAQLYALQAAGNVYAFEAAFEGFEDWLYDQENDFDGVMGALDDLQVIMDEMDEWAWEDSGGSDERSALMFEVDARCNP